MTSQPLSPNNQQALPVSESARQLLLTLLYFEVFSYPMTFEELCQLSNTHAYSTKQLASDVDMLVKRGCLYNIKDFYLTKNKEEWVRQREESNRRADQYLQKANKVSRFIMAFPYVRSVFISGSLSKHIMLEDGDIDFFIITKPGRLWIARTCLILFKKLFLLNSHKYFCVNYFIDVQHLEIEEKNRFTATEVVTLLPMYGQEWYDPFYKANEWVKQYYPHFPKRSLNQKERPKKRSFKRWLEGLMDGQLGNRLDTWFMKMTIRYWDRKFETLVPEDYEVAMKSRQYVSKHHPSNFQRKVLNEHRSLMQHFEQEHRIQLSTITE